MTRAKIALILILVLGLGGLAIYINRDLFARRPIQISYRVSPWLKSARPRVRGAADLGVPVVFSLDRYCRFKSIKVVKFEEVATNKFAHPLWELTTTSNSVPTVSFSYGERIRGMQPAAKGAQPDPLEPYVMYRLFVITDKGDAEHNFTTTPPAQPVEQAPDQPAK